MKKHVLEALVVVVVLGGIGLLWYPMLSSDVKPWEQGQDVPQTPPSEDYRVHSSMEFSIVAPPRWDARDILESLVLSPKQSIPRRSAVISAWKMEAPPPNLRELSDTQFQGSPAKEVIETRPGTFDDPASFGYALYFERNGSWYSLQYGAPIKAEEPPDMILRYFETFRVDEE